MTYCIAQGTRFNILQQLKMGKSLKIYMCLCVCVWQGRVYFRQKVAGDEHGEVERVQNMEVLLRGS